jgi:2-oxoglutarate dehydrogenase E2 component (dihydrolipoamide succinyltransferase)
MGDLIVPKVNANDQSYVLLEWLVPPDTKVSAGDCVATIETSKAVTDLVAEESGYLAHRLGPGSVCRPGDVVGRLTDTVETATEPIEIEPVVQTDPGLEPPILTRGAQDLADRHGISTQDLAALAKRLIKSEDVLAMIEATTGDDRVELSSHQRAVARAVSRSHATIPAAFTVVKVSADALQERRKALGASVRATIGVPELVVKAVAGLLDAFPNLFATLHDLALERFEDADIGVTLDLGTGLYVPVIRGAEKLSVQEISGQLTRLRVRASRGTMRESDLGPAAVTLALHTDPGVVFAQPIIFPGQVGTLSLGAMHQELRLGPDRQVETHEFFHLGLAYDHRVVNGSEAARFLTAIRQELETVATDPEGSL